MKAEPKTVHRPGGEVRRNDKLGFGRSVGTSLELLIGRRECKFDFDGPEGASKLVKAVKSADATLQ